MKSLSLFCAKNESFSYIYSIQTITRNSTKQNIFSGYAEAYRYGFQGQETDDEVKGEGNSVNYKYRMHDPRIGRFFAIDPLAPEYPWYTPYQFSGNKVIHMVELEGLEEVESGACSSGGCVAVPRPDKNFEGVKENGVVFVPEEHKNTWQSDDGKTLNSFYAGESTYFWNKEKSWYYDLNGTEYYEGDYSSGVSGNFNPSIKGAEKSFDYLKYSVENPAGAISNWWKNTDIGKDGYFTGYWDLTSFQKGVVDGGFFEGFVEGLPTILMTGGAIKGLNALRLNRGLTAMNLDVGMVNLLTTKDGYLLGSMTINSPLTFSVQRFGRLNMSYGASDYWGMKLGSSSFVGRQLNAIWPSWNPLTKYSTGYVGVGTPMKIGLTGPQSFRYGLFGGAPQFQIPSSMVGGIKSNF